MTFTQIDIWFIDKLAILVGMENALKTRKLTKELLLEAKRMEFPDYIIARLTGKTEEEIKDLRADYGIKAAYKMVDTCAAEFAAATPYYYSVYGDEGTENEQLPHRIRKRSWYLAPARSVLDRVLSLTSALYTVPGLLQKKDMKLSLSTTTQRQLVQTLILQINCISSLLHRKMLRML